MGVNIKCPKCGSKHVQLSSEQNKHGILYFIVFGIFYACWWLFRAMVGLTFLLLYDWWMAIIKAIMRKGHVWMCKRWFSNRRKVYYCHDCGHNFRA